MASALELLEYRLQADVWARLDFQLRFCKEEREVFRKTVDISAYLLIQAGGGYAVYDSGC